MLPVLEHAASGPTSAKGTLPRIAERFHLTEEDVQELLPSGRQQKLMNRLHWAKIHLERAGLLETVRRGIYQTTPEGMRVLSNPPEIIDMRYLAGFDLYREWRHKSAKKAAETRGQVTHDGGAADSADLDETPEDRIAAAVVELEDALRDDVLLRVRECTPPFFERLIVDLLLAMGYGPGMAEAGRAIGRSGDGGIDGVINEDALGLDAVYIQAKCWAADNRVGRPAIQQFVGSLHGVGATKGVFVTTSDFSAEARSYVERVQQRVILIDGQRLARLMIAHEIGVRARHTYVLRSVDEDYFIES